jgi:hypothetical protein
MTITYFTDLVTLFPKNNEFLLGPSRSFFRLIKTSESLSHILDLSRRESLKAFSGHAFNLSK